MNKEIGGPSLKCNKKTFQKNMAPNTNPQTLKKENFDTHFDDNKTEKQKIKILEKPYKYFTANENIDKNNTQTEFKRGIIEQLENCMNQDIRITKKDEKKFSQYLFYRGMTRIVNFPSLNIPPIVKEYYRKERIKSERVNFKQGVLQLSGYIYYAIQKHIILFRFQDFLQKDLQNVPYSITQIRDTLYSLKQINDKNKFFPLQDNLIIMSHPWELQFYSWTSDEEVPGMKKLKKLNVIKSLNEEQVIHFDFSSKGAVYYFDNQGKINQLIAKQEKKMYLLKTGKYSLRHYINTSHNTFEVLRKKGGTFEIFKNFFKNAQAIFKTFISYSITPKGIFCDRKRNLIFGLLRKKQKTLFSVDIVNFIVCYKINDEKTVLINNISEQGLFEEVRSFFKFSDFKIFAIEMINVNQNKNSNLQIILKNGDRLFFYVSEKGFQFTEKIDSPHKKQKKNYHSLIAYNIETDKFLSIFQGDQQKFGFLAQKVGHCGDSFEREHLSSVKVKMISEKVHDHIIHKVKENSMLDVYAKNALKFKSRTHTLNNLHELAEQVFKPPSYYLFLSDISLQFIAYLRPLDILFTVLMIFDETNLILCIKLLRQIFFGDISEIGNNNLDIYELCSMLVQINVDQQGSYYFSRQIIQSLIEKYMQKQQKNEQFYRKTRRKSQSSIPIEAVLKCLKKYTNYENKVYRFRDLKDYHMKFIMKLYLQMSLNFGLMPIKNEKFAIKFQSYEGKDPKEIQNKSTQSIQFKLNCIILYFSRIVRPCWKQKITDLSVPHTTYLIGKIQKLQIFLQKVTEDQEIKNIKSGVISEHKSFFTKLESLMYAIEKLPYLPSITIKQALLEQDNFLQPYIFKSIQIQFRSIVVRGWQKLFPCYISKQMIYFTALYDEIEKIKGKESILTILKEKKKKLPKYFVQYLKQVRGLKQYQLDDLVQVPSNNKLIKIPEALTKRLKDNEIQSKQKVAMIKEEFNKNKIMCRQRFLLVPYFNKYLSPDDQKTDYYKDLISRIILQYELYTFFDEHKSQIDKISLQMLQNQFLQLSELQNLIFSSNSDVLKVLYESFTNNSSDDKIARLNTYLTRVWMKNIEENQTYFNIKKGIKNDIKMILNKSNYQIPLKAIIDSVDSILLDKVPIISATIKQWLLFKRKKLISRDIIWLPQFLLDMGCSVDQVLRIYIEYLKTFSEKSQFEAKELFYYQKYISCYVIIRDYKREEIPNFTNLMNEFVQVMEIQTEKKIGIKSMLEEILEP